MSPHILLVSVWSTVFAATEPTPAVSTNAVAVPGATSDSSPLPCAAQIQGDPRAANAHVIVVWKAARRAALYRGGQLASLDAGSACWDIGLAHAYPPGHKTRQGDLKTPEGWYRTSDKPWSQFDHAIAVHYPNTADARAGVAAGLIDQATATRIERAIKADRKPPQDTALGGEILLHAGGASDWTLGCVAFDDRDIARLRRALPPTMSIDLLIVP